MQSLPGIDEVNLFREDDHVIHISNPKLQAAIQANTYVVSGNAQTKTIEELMPDILPQLGPEKMQQLAQRMQSMQTLFGTRGAGGAAPAAAAAAGDDDVPTLVGATDFEATAKADEKKKATANDPNEQD
jgi:nascent polypeptide-associated complex subunit beta